MWVVACPLTNNKKRHDWGHIVISRCKLTVTAFSKKLHQWDVANSSRGGTRWATIYISSLINSHALSVLRPCEDQVTLESSWQDQSCCLESAVSTLKIGTSQFVMCPHLHSCGFDLFMSRIKHRLCDVHNHCPQLSSLSGNGTLAKPSFTSTSAAPAMSRVSITAACIKTPLFKKTAYSQPKSSSL